MKGNFGGLRERTNYYRVGEICPMLQRSMIHAKTAIIRRLSSKMSIVHPWMFCFDLHMPHEVFDLLNKEILDLTRFGIEAEDTPDSVTIYNIFSNLRRLSNLFDQFEDCGGFRKQLGKGKCEAKLIVNSEKKETMMDTRIRMGLVNNE